MIASLKQVTAAYEEGGVAILKANVSAKLEEQTAKAGILSAEISRQSALYGVNPDQVAKQKTALGELNATTALERDQQLEIIQQNYAEEIAKQNVATTARISALHLETAALFDNAAAQREAAVQGSAKQFVAAHPGLSDDEAAKEVAQLREISDAEHARQIAGKAASLDIAQAYALEINELKEVGEVMQANGRSTITVDAAVYDANRKMIEQWDQAVAKIGTLWNAGAPSEIRSSPRARTSAGKYLLRCPRRSTTSRPSSRSSSQPVKRISKSWPFIPKGRSASAGFQSLFGQATKSIGSALGVNLPGTKADGSSASPFYVIPSDVSGNPLGGGLGGGGGNGGGDPWGFLMAETPETDPAPAASAEPSLRSLAV